MFSLKKKIKKTGTIIDMRERYWGHNVLMITPDKKKNGHYDCLMLVTPAPKVGDKLYLRVNTNDGNDLDIACRVLAVRPKGNPRDMYEVDFRTSRYL